MILNKPIDKDKVVITAQKQQESKQELVGRIRPRGGHTLFKYNTKTGKITEAEFEQQDAIYDPHAERTASVRKVVVEVGCIYISALNEKNALRKLRKRK